MSVTVMSRLQTGLLLAIVALLALNILLPVHYTLQRVKVGPVSLTSEDGGGAQVVETDDEPPHPQGPAPQDPDDWKQVALKRRTSNDIDAAEVEERTPARDMYSVQSSIKEHMEREDLRWQGEMQMKYEKTAANINFHDPAERMAYYRKLRNNQARDRYINMRQLHQQRVKRRAEMVHELWDDWFEDENQFMKLDTLSDYVTEDITPAAIEAQLTQCTTALGVSLKTLENQHDDLEKTSIKLSAFLSAIKSLLPDSFSSEFKSPCWFSDKINGRSTFLGITGRVIGLDGRLNLLPNQAAYLARQGFSQSYTENMYCLPHFFLAGFPKSATTTMADALCTHPQISSAVVKESHWWTRAPIISPDTNLLRLNVLRYLLHYEHMAHYAIGRTQLLSMDGSQSTLWDSNFVFNGHDFCSTPAAISHILPKAKFIVLMREPSERLYSYYLWSCSYTYGNDTSKWPSKIRNDPAGNFHSEASQVVFDFNQCLQSRSLYECSIQYTFTNGTKATNYCGQIGFRLVVSIYYIHIVKFLQFFPQEQFLFLKMEDMTQEPIRFMKQVTTFLNIESYPPSKISDLLERKHNQQKANIEPMHEDTRRLLHTFYGPFNRQLADLLKDKRFLWDYS